MKCNCGFSGKEGEFGVLDTHTHGGSSSFTPRLPVDEDGIRYGCGSRDVHICPECGALYCFATIKKRG
jgi:hypothetical protein